MCFFFFFWGGLWFWGFRVSGFQNLESSFLFGFAGCWGLLFEALESAVQEYEDRSKVDAATLLQEFVLALCGLGALGFALGIVLARGLLEASGGFGKCGLCRGG